MRNINPTASRTYFGVPAPHRRTVRLLFLLLLLLGFISCWSLFIHHHHHRPPFSSLRLPQQPIRVPQRKNEEKIQKQNKQKGETSFVDSVAPENVDDKLMILKKETAEEGKEYPPAPFASSPILSSYIVISAQSCHPGNEEIKRDQRRRLEEGDRSSMVSEEDGAEQIHWCGEGEEKERDEIQSHRPEHNRSSSSSPPIIMKRRNVTCSDKHILLQHRFCDGLLHGFSALPNSLPHPATDQTGVKNNSSYFLFPFVESFPSFSSFTISPAPLSNPLQKQEDLIPEARRRAQDKNRISPHSKGGKESEKEEEERRMIVEEYRMRVSELPSLFPTKSFSKLSSREQLSKEEGEEGEYFEQHSKFNNVKKYISSAAKHPAAKNDNREHESTVGMNGGKEKRFRENEKITKQRQVEKEEDATHKQQSNALGQTSREKVISFRPLTIDVVITYVNESSTTWRREFLDAKRREELLPSQNKKMGKKMWSDFSSHHVEGDRRGPTADVRLDLSRFRDWNELIFTLRSIYFHMKENKNKKINGRLEQQQGESKENDPKKTASTAMLELGKIFLLVKDHSHVPFWLKTQKKRKEAAKGNTKESDPNDKDAPLDENENEEHADEKKNVGVEIVTHEELRKQIPPVAKIGGEEDAEGNPPCNGTFNSNAIETMLPFIPNLSRFFLYFNNDMFLGRQISLFDLFRPVSPHRFGGRHNSATRGHSVCAPSHGAVLSTRGREEGEEITSRRRAKRNVTPREEPTSCFSGSFAVFEPILYVDQIQSVEELRRSQKIVCVQKKVKGEGLGRDSSCIPVADDHVDQNNKSLVGNSARRRSSPREMNIVGDDEEKLEEGCCEWKVSDRFHHHHRAEEEVEKLRRRRILEKYPAEYRQKFENTQRGEMRAPSPPYSVSSEENDHHQRFVTFNKKLIFSRLFFEHEDRRIWPAYTFAHIPRLFDTELLKEMLSGKFFSTWVQKTRARSFRSSQDVWVPYLYTYFAAWMREREYQKYFSCHPRKTNLDAHNEEKEEKSEKDKERSIPDGKTGSSSRKLEQQQRVQLYPLIQLEMHSTLQFCPSSSSVKTIDDQSPWASSRKGPVDALYLSKNENEEKPEGKIDPQKFCSAFMSSFTQQKFNGAFVALNKNPLYFFGMVTSEERILQIMAELKTQTSLFVAINDNLPSDRFALTSILFRRRRRTLLTKKNEKKKENNNGGRKIVEWNASSAANTSSQENKFMSHKPHHDHRQRVYQLRDSGVELEQELLNIQRLQTLKMKQRRKGKAAQRYDDESSSSIFTRARPMVLLQQLFHLIVPSSDAENLPPWEL